MFNVYLIREENKIFLMKVKRWHLYLEPFTYIYNTTTSRCYAACLRWRMPNVKSDIYVIRYYVVLCAAWWANRYGSKIGKIKNVKSDIYVIKLSGLPNKCTVCYCDTLCMCCLMSVSVRIKNWESQECSVRYICY